MSVVDLLDEYSEQQWAEEVERSLREDTDRWLRAADHGDLSRDRSWILLAWVESAASDVVISRRPELVETAALAMSLLEDGPLDRRDVMVVASLVRRAALLARLEFTGLADGGCQRAGTRGRRCAEWLSQVSPDTPPTHVEVGSGDGFRFERVPPGTHDATVRRTDFMRSPASREVRQWPPPVRTVMLLALIALAGVGLVTLLYSQGIVAIAGPFVAAAVGPVLVLVGLLWRDRRVTRREQALVDSLRRWHLELERERVLAPAARSTSASDQSLDTAVETIENALRQFARAHTASGAATAETLAAQTDGWARRAEITRGIRADAASARRLANASRRSAR